MENSILERTQETHRDYPSLHNTCSISLQLEESMDSVPAPVSSILDISGLGKMCYTKFYSALNRSKMEIETSIIFNI